MSRAANNSSPLRNLENELERIKRHNSQLKRGLAATTAPRRLAALKEQLTRGEAHVGVAKRVRSQLLDITQAIDSQHLELMLTWHHNRPIDVPHYQRLGKTNMSKLRQAVENVVKGRVSEGNFITVLVTGAHPPQLEVLWKCYQQLAAQQGWNLDKYLLKPYDPQLDSEAAENRTRGSRRQTRLDSDGPKPTLRLLSSATDAQGQRAKVCDLFRIDKDDDFKANLNRSTGFALQISGDGVSGWLEDEHGTIHFFDQRLAGPKRRIRLKVSVFTGKLLSIELPSDWLEPVAAPDRDPLRTVNLTQQTIIDHSGHERNFAQNKLSSALAAMITQRHERALWKAIGYHGIPSEAQLLKEIDIPF